MPERIVDEAFAAELANRGDSEGERFTRIMDTLKGGGDDAIVEAVRSLVEIIRDQADRINVLEEQLHRVYIKSGESLAQLVQDLRSDQKSSSEESMLHHVRKSSSELLENMRAELKLFRSDVYAQSDLQLKHTGDRMDLLEHDAARESAALAKRFDALEERVEKVVEGIGSGEE